MMRALFGEEREMRFRTHDFPFTEPSLEPDVSCSLRRAAAPVPPLGVDRDRGLRDGRSRAVRVCRADPEEWTGFAFGMGLERVAMLRHGLPALGAVGERPPGAPAV